LYYHESGGNNNPKQAVKMGEKTIQQVNPNQILVVVSTAMAIGLLAIIGLLFVSAGPASSTVEAESYTADS